MSSAIKELKARLRRQVRVTLQTMALPEREAASAQACRLLQQQAAWKEARSVMGYSAFGSELDVWPALLAGRSQGKIICLPRFVAAADAYEAAQLQDPQRDLFPGRLGIREPGQHCPSWALNELDLILVPGVAFDLDGRRVGRGKGYYDRWLAAVGATKCGIAYDQQVLDRIPVEPHDIQLDCILTPTRWLVAGRGRS